MIKKALFILRPLIIAVNCSDNSTEPDKNNSGELPQIAIKEVNLPAQMSQSSDPNAQMATGLVAMANSYRGWSYAFKPPVGLNKTTVANDLLGDDPEWTETWNIDGLAVTMLVFESDDSYTWETRLTGVDGTQVYNDYLFIYSEQKKTRVPVL